MAVDYIPAGGGPQNAQRVGITVGSGGRAAPAQQDNPTRSTGLSTGTKLAIGAGAAALFGCYELGCFSRSRTGPGNGSQQQPAYNGGYQQR